MTRTRTVRDANNKVVSTNTLEIPFIRVQPVTKAADGKTGSPQFTGQLINFSPDIDLLSTDSIEFNGKNYDIQSYYPARDKNNVVHHLEVII